MGRRSAQLGRQHLRHRLIQAALVHQVLGPQSGRHQVVPCQSVDLAGQAVGQPVDLPGDIARKQDPLASSPLQMARQVGSDLLPLHVSQVEAELQATANLSQAALGTRPPGLSRSRNGHIPAMTRRQPEHTPATVGPYPIRHRPSVIRKCPCW